MARVILRTESDGLLRRILGDERRSGLELAEDDPKPTDRAVDIVRYVRSAARETADHRDQGRNLLIGQMLERFGRHDEQRFSLVADPLADRCRKLLIGRMRSEAGQVWRPDCADIGLVEHLVPAQAFAMTAET